MKSRVVAVLKSPVRLLAALVRALGKAFGKVGALAKRGGPGKSATSPAPAVGLSKADGPEPSAKGGKLAGLKRKRRVPLFVGLAVVAVVAVLVLKPGGEDDNKAVRDSLASFAKATRDKDYQTLCDKLFASALVQTIRSAGLPCEVALRTGLDSRKNPQLEVLGVEVKGDQALARTRSSAVGEAPAIRTLRLVKEDGSWRIASEPDAGSGATAP